MSSRLSPLSASYVPHALCYIKSKRCACSNCTEISKKEAFMFVIDPDTCTACDSCMDACPCDAISIVDGVHTIDPDLCVDCGACMDVCEFGSILSAESASNRPHSCHGTLTRCHTQARPQAALPLPPSGLRARNHQTSVRNHRAQRQSCSAPTVHSARYQRFQREPPRPYREP